MSLGVVEVCYQRSSSTLSFQDLEDEALSSELVSRQLPHSEHALHVVIKHHLSMAVPLAFLLREQIKIALASSTDLRTVPTIVIAHTFCASRDTRISHGSCVLIQGYFCAVQNYAERLSRHF